MDTPPDQPAIRPLRADEAEALRTFYNGLSDEARRLFRPLGWQASAEQCRAVCDARGGAHYDLVLEAGGRIVGWAFLRRLDEPAADLGIGIADPFTNRGLGRQMMRDLIAHARSRGAEAITLRHVADNARAHHLYELCGFVATGSFHNDADGLDYVAMRLTL